MKELEQAIAKYDELCKECDELNAELKECYVVDDECYDEDYRLIDAIYAEELYVKWDDYRDIEGIEDMVSVQGFLVGALEKYNLGDAKSVHSAKKDMEDLVSSARQIKKKRNEDIAKAQRQIDEMDRVIEICDRFRK